MALIKPGHNSYQYRTWDGHSQSAIGSKQYKQWSKCHGKTGHAGILWIFQQLWTAWWACSRSHADDGHDPGHGASVDPDHGPHCQEPSHWMDFLQHIHHQLWCTLHHLASAWEHNESIRYPASLYMEMDPSAKQSIQSKYKHQSHIGDHQHWISSCTKPLAQPVDMELHNQSHRLKSNSHCHGHQPFGSPKWSATIGDKKAISKVITTTKKQENQ